MSKQTWTIAKMNLKNIKVPFFVSVLIFAAMSAQTIVYTIIAFATGKAGEQLSISSGNYLWLLVLLAAIFIPAKNFRRIVNLGGKRNGFFRGSMVAYAAIAGAVSIANTAYYYIVERFFVSTDYFVSFTEFMENTALMNTNYINVNLIELFGWTQNGIFFALIQQFAFLLLLAAVVHTLTAMQDRWYGWVADILIAAILATFIPIPVLRPVLLAFFNLIIFNSNAFLQIIACLLLAIVIYALSKPILSRKAI